jgi:hypothetical protein
MEVSRKGQPEEQEIVGEYTTTYMRMIMSPFHEAGMDAHAAISVTTVSLVNESILFTYFPP